MPESVTDRPTKSHEQVFLLTKSERYFYDAEAVREPHARLWDETNGGSISTGRMVKAGGAMGDMSSRPKGYSLPNPAGRNMRSVLTIPSESYPGSHYAIYPRKLIEPLIKAGSSERGCCPRCRAPWVRVVEKEVCSQGRGRDHIAGGDHMSGNGWEGVPRATLRTSTLGWRPTCKCFPPDIPLDRAKEAFPIPCTILDPFCGSGTSLIVAQALGRDAIGLDLSREYLTRDAQRRITRPHARPIRPSREEVHPLFPDD